MNAIKLAMELAMVFIKDFFGIKKVCLLQEHLGSQVKVHTCILRENILALMLLDLLLAMVLKLV
jgi:hypothetical protein